MNQTVNVTEVKLVLNPQVVLNNRDWKKVRQYMREKYQVCNRTEGKIVLEKRPEIIITLTCPNGEVKELGFSNRLAEFYGNELHAEKLYELFNEDVKLQKVNVQKGKNGYYVSMSQKED